MNNIYLIQHLREVPFDYVVTYSLHIIWFCIEVNCYNNGNPCTRNMKCDSCCGDPVFE